MFNEIKRDDSNAYAGAPWLDADEDGDADDTAQGDHKFPIAYTRSGINGDVKATALPKFKVAKPVNGTYKMRGIATFRGALELPFPIPAIYFAEKPATRVGDLITADEKLEAILRVPDTIFRGEMQIVWQLGVQLPGQNLKWEFAGATANTMYVTGIDRFEPEFHTLLEIGCKRATGRRPVDAAGKRAIADAIWREFEDGPVVRVDGVTLKFNHDPGHAVFADGLLLHPQAKGQCTAWAELLLFLLEAQGVPALSLGVYPKAGRNNIEFKLSPAQGSGGANYPIHRFINHQIVHVADYPDQVFDPSYGIMVKADHREVRLRYEDERVTRHLTMTPAGEILEADDDVKGIRELQWPNWP